MKNKGLISIIIILVIVIIIGAICLIHRNMEGNFEHNINIGENGGRFNHDMVHENGSNINNKNRLEENNYMGYSENRNFSKKIPTMPGQEAFGTIQEIINILEADSKTDWKKVNIDILQRHLIDMDELTMRSKVERKNIENGLEMTITGSGRTLDAINRMVPTHKKVTLGSFKKWKTTIKNISNGVILTAISNDKNEVDKIRALGFIGIMAIGSQHPLHHLMMAKGNSNLMK